jgi:hypothetical protein
MGLLDHKVLKAYKVKLVLLVLLVLLDLKDLLDQKETLETRDLKVLLAQQGHKGLPELLEPQEEMVQLGHKVLLVPMEQTAQMEQHQV